VIKEIVFGGLDSKQPKPEIKVAPLPLEYQNPKPSTTIKNRSPKSL